MNEKANKIALSTAYLAPIDWYQCINAASEAVIDGYCNYVKQTYRNRCIIASANGVQTLSIPVIKPDTPKCYDRDIRISEHGSWRHIHWNAIISAYRSSPFFDYYEDDFRPFYEKKYEFLYDFNEELRLLICELIDIQPIVIHSGHFIESDSDIRDLREAINPKKPPVNTDFKPYYQVFTPKYGFQANLSIIDLLFNLGNEAGAVIQS